MGNTKVFESLGQRNLYYRLRKSAHVAHTASFLSTNWARTIASTALGVDYHHRFCVVDRRQLWWGCTWVDIACLGYEGHWSKDSSFLPAVVDYFAEVLAYSLTNKLARVAEAKT